MGSQTNSSVAHDFYYRGVGRGEEHEYKGCTVSYAGNRAFSYYTMVAMVIPAKGMAGVKPSDTQSGVTLLSMDSMSSTTGRHISYLGSASPFPVVRVPMEYGRKDMTPKELADRFYDRLGRLYAELNHADARYEFASTLAAMDRIETLAPTEWSRPLKAARFKKFRTVDVSKAAEELKAKRRKEAAKQQAETRALLAKYVKGKDGAAYCTLMRVLFDSSFESPQYPFTPEQRSRIRAKFAHGDASFVWPVPETDEIVTSRHVRVSLQEARVLLKAWAAGKDMRTMPIGSYTIVKYTGDTIQIGCHRIPRANMLALYEAVVGKPFPKKPGKAEPDAAPETEAE